MANKTKMTEEKLQKAKNENAVVYKVMVALALLCGALTGLRLLRAYYATIGGFEKLYPMTIWIAVGGLALFLIGAVLKLAVKQKVVQAVSPWLIAIAALVCATGVFMRLYWTEAFPSLYFLCCAFLLQYIIFLLYRWEFFLFSLSTASTGFLFFQLSGGVEWTLLTILLLVIEAVILIGTFLAARLASGNKGMLIFGKKRIQLLPAKSNPVLIYLVDALWLVCVLVALLLGGLFAYYCMFAAIAVEFIAAVYYTFQLN